MAFQVCTTTTPLKATLRLHQHAEFFKNRTQQPRLTLLQKKTRKLVQVVEMSSKADDSIQDFYSSINDKNLKQLEELIADDCFFEDYSFPKPFIGKQETMQFFKRLTKSMGENMEFKVEDTFHGDDGDLRVGVNWHIDWKEKQIPFTRGCSYFHLAEDGEKLVIMKAKVIIESPIKPGELVLVLCNTVTSIFDAWPKTAECFLSIPQAIFQQLSSPQAMFQLFTGRRAKFYLLKCRKDIFRFFVELLK